MGIPRREKTRASYFSLFLFFFVLPFLFLLSVSSTVHILYCHSKCFHHCFTIRQVHFHFSIDRTFQARIFGFSSFSLSQVQTHQEMNSQDGVNMLSSDISDIHMTTLEDEEEGFLSFSSYIFDSHFLTKQKSTVPWLSPRSCTVCQRLLSDTFSRKEKIHNSYHFLSSLEFLWRVQTQVSFFALFY